MRQQLLKDRRLVATLLDRIERKRLFYRDMDSAAETTHLEKARLQRRIEWLDYSLKQDWCQP